MTALTLLAVLPPAADCTEAIAAAQRAFAARQFEIAAAGFQRAAQDCPFRPEILVPLGQVLLLTGREVEAEEALKSALQADPSHVPALYALGRMYHQQKRFPEAAAQLEKVVKIEPKHYRAWDNLGVTFDVLNRDSDALRSFFKALDLVMKDHPGYDWAHANLADFFLRRNENDKAFQLAVEAARRSPQSARNCFLAGKALVKLEKHELSLRWLERATQLDPAYREAFYLLGRTYSKLGRAPESQKALDRVRELSRQ